MGFEMFTSRSKMGLGGQRPSAMALQDSSNYLLSWVGYILLARTLIPPEIQWILRKLWALFMRPYTSFFCVFHVYERHQETGRKNDLFKVVELYLDIAGLCKEADQVVLATKPKKEKDILFKLTGSERVEDRFKGVKVWWSLKPSDDGGAQKKEPPRGGRREKKGEGGSGKNEFVLKMHKKDKQFVMTEYLDHVIAEANEFKRKQKELKLYTNTHSMWSKNYTFKHPSTFDTLAMDPDLKAAVKADLDNFRQSEDYFRRVGRAWKRGYLLYGPPGTGKSSMIAAMANYLKYDVYDLELTQVHSNDALKRLFRDTSNKSIVVIEDIDCSLNLAGKRNNSTRPRHVEDIRELKMGRRRGLIREENVTLSALLNSVDGLWSCSTDERIIIFTTNHVEKLDPALIRPGRMDMRIHMSYCSFHSFKQLARSYLSIDWHPEYDTIKKLIEDEGALMTPADVTEHLFGMQDDPTHCMRSVIAELQKSVNPNPDPNPPACPKPQTLMFTKLSLGEVSETGVVS